MRNVKPNSALRDNGHGFIFRFWIGNRNASVNKLNFLESFDAKDQRKGMNLFQKVIERLYLSHFNL